MYFSLNSCVLEWERLTYTLHQILPCSDHYMWPLHSLCVLTKGTWVLASDDSLGFALTDFQRQKATLNFEAVSKWLNLLKSLIYFPEHIISPAVATLQVLINLITDCILYQADADFMGRKMPHLLTTLCHEGYWLSSFIDLVPLAHPAFKTALAFKLLGQS